MNDQQPAALRLAELLSRAWQPTAQHAALELRALHSERESLRAELEAHRLYARALCKAVDAATDFAGTVAGGASWWDDVWADHAAALDRARARISDAAMQASEGKAKP